jgi:hypothetical protein
VNTALTESRGGAAPPAAAGELAELFMMRVAALPFDTVDRLRCPPAAERAREALRHEERLRATGAALSDPIAARVPDIPDERTRRDLLDLRRRLYNNRLPRDPAAALDLAASLGDPLGARVAAWLSERGRWETQRAVENDAFRAELEHSRAELRRICADDRLRFGLLLASPTLDGRLGSFLRATGPLDKRGRKTERSLLSYLYRTACKTSPFSTFTGVALGRFEPGGDRAAPPGLTGISGTWSSHPRVNVVALARLAESIAADEGLRGDLLVSPASGWNADDDLVRYVRRSRDVGGDDTAVSFDAARDRLYFLRRSGALEALLGRLRDQGSARHRDLVALLADRYGATPGDAEHYLSTLIQLGILQLTGLDIDVHAPDPVRDFQHALRAVARPWADRVADLLDGPISLLERYPDGDLTTRRGLLADLRRDLTAVLDALGAPDASLPQTLLYEDVRAREDSVACDTAEWQDLAAQPLAALGRVLPAFDVALPHRLTLRGFFLARYGAGGRCDDVLKLVHDFHEDIFDQYLRLTSDRPAAPDGAPLPEENWLRLPQLTALDRARAAFIAQMRARYAALPADAGELELDDAALDEVAACLEPLGAEYAPQSHFVQLAAGRADPLVVLNDSFGGLCFPFTRFTHCFDGEQGAGDADGLSALLRRALRERQPSGAVFAEVTAGAATTNLNLHGRLTDYEIVCPGEPGRAPREARIDLDDLFVEHEPGTDRLVLRSRRLDREVIPVYFGYLLPMVLPEIPRTLLLLSPTSRAALDVWRAVAPTADGDGVARRPRVRYRSLVLARRSWTAPLGALPPRAAVEPDAQWFLAWQRWRIAHGLPDRVFATVRRPEGDAGPAGWFGGGKPQYVDFDSPLSLVALEGLAADGGDRVTFEEMLPAPEELHVVSEGGRHVAEVALEILPPPAGPRAGTRPAIHEEVGPDA